MYNTIAHSYDEPYSLSKKNYRIIFNNSGCCIYTAEHFIWNKIKYLKQGMSDILNVNEYFYAVSKVYNNNCYYTIRICNVTKSILQQLIH